MFLEFFGAILAYVILYYIYCYKKIHWHFDSKGLKYCKGVPIFGNVAPNFFLKKHIIEVLDGVYKAFPNERYVGFAEGIVPIVLIRDPDLMKDIVIKDANHFADRKQFFPESIEPLLGRSLTVVKEDEWRPMRVKQNPAFTASKLKHMMVKMDEMAQHLVAKLKLEDLSQELKINIAMYKYTAEAAMYSAFDIRDSEERSDKDNILIKVGTTFTFNRLMKTIYFTSLQFPRIGEFFKHFGVTVFPRKTHEFFVRVIKDAIEHRRKNNIVLNDYLQVLSERYEEWPIDDIVGQVVFAFAASFDTASNILSLSFHELALNPDIQEKLYQEIIKHKETEGSLTYDNLKELKYLDCVLNETSRKWAGSIVMDRICTQPYMLPPPREGAKPYLIKPGDLVFNVINPVHYDAKYHPKPEIFDPERFSDENKHNIKACTFMPFGLGPRGCIGARYVRIMMQVMIYHMVLNFKIQKCSKTKESIKLEPDDFSTHCVGGSWVKLELR